MIIFIQWGDEMFTVPGDKHRSSGSTSISTTAVPVCKIGNQSSANTTYTATTVVDGSAWTLSAVAVYDIAVTEAESSGAVYWGMITAVSDATDTLTVSAWVNRNTGQNGLPTAGKKVTVFRLGLVKSLTITALTSNSNTIFVGVYGSAVTTDIPLAPGDSKVLRNDDPDQMLDATKIYAITASGTETAYWNQSGAGNIALGGELAAGMLAADGSVALTSDWDAGSYVIKSDHYGKGIPVYNVLNDATGDGVTDDASSIQGIIDAVGTAGGGIVYFPVGTYLVNTALTLVDNVELLGDGEGSVIMGAASLTSVITGDGIDNARLKGLKIVHNNATNTTYAIYIYNLSKDVVIEDCIIDSDATSIMCRNVMRPVIKNNRIVANGYNGICIYYTTTTGTINTGVSATTMTVGSSGYFSAGDGIIIPGAGAAGIDLVTTIATIVGTTWTLDDAASTSVTDAYIRHYESVDEDYAYCYATIQGNYINQDAARPGIEMRSGGGKILENTIVAPAINGGTAGITYGWSNNGIVSNNYVFGFAMGIEAGMLGDPGSVLVDTGTAEAGTMGGITITNNIVKSCDIGISTSNAANYARTVTLSGNHIIITADSWSNHRGIDVNCKDISIIGGSISYQTNLAYTDPNSRKYTGCRTLSNARYVKFIGVEFANLDIGLNGGYVATEEVFVGCSFDNCYYSVSQYASAPAGNVVRFDSCQFHNVRTARVQRNIFVTNCSFKNESDFAAYQKYPVQWRIANDNFGVFRNNLYSGMLRGGFGAQADYGVSSATYMYPTIYIDDDLITVKAGLTSNQIYNYLVTTFGTYLLPFIYNKPIYVYTTGTKYMFTYNGKVKYAAIGSDPTGDSWAIGDRVEEITPVTGGNIGIVCTVAGTQGTLSGVTGSISSGTATLAVNSATNLEIGMYITIAGVTGVKKITNVSGTTVTIDSNSDATVTAAAVAYSTATFKAYGAIA